jgi:RNA polymerase sigma factor (sigma-70 family)
LAKARDRSEWLAGNRLDHRQADASADAPDPPHWPPDNLAAYYQSEAFLRQVRSLQRRLERSYSHIDAESIVFDAVSDLLVREIRQHCIYDQFMIKFKTEGQFLRYLYETCCSKIIDNARSFQRKFRQLTEEENVEDDSMGPEEAAIEEEERARNVELVRELETDVISKLPKLDRLILKHRIAGKKFQEIADLLDTGLSTVHRRYKAVLTKLANRLTVQISAEKIRPTR